MEKLYIDYNTDSNEQQVLNQIHDFFGKEFNLKRKIFSNEIDYVKSQNEKELFVITTKLSAADIEKNIHIDKICVVTMQPQLEITKLTAKEAFSLCETSEIRKKYNTVLYTDKTTYRQSFVLDKNDIFGFTKAVLIFNSEPEIDVESYKYGGINYLAVI